MRKLDVEFATHTSSLRFDARPASGNDKDHPLFWVVFVVCIVRLRLSLRRVGQRGHGRGLRNEFILRRRFDVPDQSDPG